MISHDKSTGTGFVLTDGNKFILVTAAHVFDGTPDDETTIVFRREEADGVYQKEPAKLVIRKENKPAWTLCYLCWQSYCVCCKITLAVSDSTFTHEGRGGIVNIGGMAVSNSSIQV